MADLDERVLVVSRDDAAAVAGPGFTRCGYSKFERILGARSARFMARRDVEDDPAWRQLIPYTVLRCGGEVFAYRRGGGEGRLLGRRSLGVGGHVAEGDGGGRGPADAFYACTVRELNEEVDLRSGFLFDALGLISDDSDLVGRVHLGMVQVCELDSPEVEPREGGLVEAGFVPVGALAAARDDYESWSRLLIDAAALAKRPSAAARG